MPRAIWRCRCCATWRSPSRPANAWRWSGRRAPARARCCARSTATTAPDAGSIRVRHGADWVELVRAEPRTVLDVRRRTMGFVSQFLRVIPRIATVDVVAEPPLRLGHRPPTRRADRAEFLLGVLSIPPSAVVAAARDLLGRRAAAGQHRALADRRLSRSCCSTSPPPRSIPANRDGVVELIHQRREAGVRDRRHLPRPSVRDALATRIHDVALSGNSVGVLA